MFCVFYIRRQRLNQESKAESKAESTAESKVESKAECGAYFTVVNLNAKQRNDVHQFLCKEI